MKKFVLLLIMSVTPILSMLAEEVRITPSITSTTNSQSGNGPNRIPQRGMLEIIVDTDRALLTVTCDSDNEAQVYLYNRAGELVDYSETVNTSFLLPTVGTYLIYIEGENWYSASVIEL